MRKKTKKRKQNNLEKKKFLAMSTWTTDMLENPNQFYKDIVALSAAVAKKQ